MPALCATQAYLTGAAGTPNPAAAAAAAAAARRPPPPPLPPPPEKSSVGWYIEPNMRSGLIEAPVNMWLNLRDPPVTTKPATWRVLPVGERARGHHHEGLPAVAAREWVAPLAVLRVGELAEHGRQEGNVCTCGYNKW